MSYKAQIEVSTEHHRRTLAETEKEVRHLADALKRYVTDCPDPQRFAIPLEEQQNRSEAVAQCMLALRHIEDARMRLGKVMQYALQGGVSKYEQEG